MFFLLFIYIYIYVHLNVSVYLYIDSYIGTGIDGYIDI